MNILSLISAVIISVITPVDLPEISGVREGRAVFVEDQAIVAVIPDAFTSADAKNQAMHDAAERLGKEWGKEILLTDDLMTYMSLARMERRGADDYERRHLAVRLARVRSYSYPKEPVSG